MDEAKRLLKASILKVEQSDVELEDFGALMGEPLYVSVGEEGGGAWERGGKGDA